VRDHFRRVGKDCAHFAPNLLSQFLRLLAALVAQDDKNKKSSNGAPEGAPLQSKSQDSRENPHTERDNCLLCPRHLHELHLVAFHFLQTFRGQVHHVARVVGRKRNILAIFRADIQMIDGVIGGGEWRG